MRLEVDHLIYFGFEENFAYFFANRGDQLYFWSPYAFTLIRSSGIQDVLVEADYVFFNDDNGGHVINASVEEMCKHNQRYFYYHPPQVIDFHDSFWNHCGMNEHLDEFDEEYGLDFSKWGHPKTDFIISNFVYYVDRNYHTIQEDFDSIAEGTINPAVHNNVSLYGNPGYLLADVEDNTIVRRLCWVGYSGSDELTRELQEIVAAEGKLIESDVRFDDSVVYEYAYNMHNSTIHVGLTVKDGEPVSYVYLRKDNK